MFFSIWSAVVEARDFRLLILTSGFGIQYWCIRSVNVSLGWTIFHFLIVQVNFVYLQLNFIVLFVYPIKCEFGRVCERRKLRVNVGKSKVMRCSRYGNGDRMHVILNGGLFL